MSDQQDIRVAICSDTDFIVPHVERALSNVAGIELLAVTASGIKTVTKVRNGEADVVILDVGLDEKTVTTSITRIRQARQGTHIILVGSLSFANVRVSMNALVKGAAEYIPIPAEYAKAGDEKSFKDQLVRVVRALAINAEARKSSAPNLQTAQKAKQKPLVLAIGSSTGGPQAVTAFLKSLEAPFPLPIVITQHMPKGFTAIFAQNLGRNTAFEAKEAANGDVLEPGHIYVAPGGLHLTFEREGTRTKVVLDDGPPENFCKPAVDPMFRSICDVYDGRVLAVVLTGMGNDGAGGAEPIINTGGTVLAQDEATSVVWGMPGAVAKAGLATEILPLDAIGPKVLDIVRT